MLYPSERPFPIIRERVIYLLWWKFC